MAERVRIVVSGRVQGVGFRVATRRCAVGLGIEGTVRNLATGDVAILAEGEQADLERLVEWARQGPRTARVAGVEVSKSHATGEFSGFEVR